jgi:uncharacterized surface protein with fasciclin (FAS1) repeats
MNISLTRATPVRRTRIFAGIAIAGALVLSACNDDGPDADTTETTEVATAGDIVDIATATDGFSTLVVALQAAGLVETLQGDGPFTVFAPTDEAFAALPEGLLDTLLLPENQELLTRILTYHVVSGEVFSGDITDGEVATVEGSSILLSTDNGVMVDGATVIVADIAATNGVVHVIDSVILPADIAATL